ncbi:MAG: endonuclease MutS2 [Bacteroidetes bacterium]|nr:endonuclease MutS2 [Bacteroidota bacterium]
MIYPENIELKLGFDQVRQMVKDNCLSDLGVHFADKMQFLSDAKQLSKLLLQNHEFRNMLLSGDTFPSSNFINISNHLEAIKAAGSHLPEEPMFEVYLALKTIGECLHFFKEKSTVYEQLHKLSETIEFDAANASLIGSKFDDRGQLKDNASENLMSIRTSISKLDRSVRKTIESILRKTREANYSADDAQVSIRDGRLVIPVAAENKRRVKGVVQDESATGQTVYIEPTEIIEINNEISELHYAERREIIKILTKLADCIRPSIPTLLKANRFLGTIDFIRAKAKLSIAIDACLPQISPNPGIKLRNARHPLLQLRNKELGKDVVPLDVHLSVEHRILVISGPNAGGKSVSLKTIGLIQYMFQCGLLIPAAEDSEIYLFQQLFIDIGDEQSIENDLSTYSSHLQGMRFFLENANTRTLFLIDEFGTGTEPQFGGAIAEAVLDQLNSQSAFGVVTTHYANLKKFAEKNPGIINGAMRFDVDGMKPLYQLTIGKPGSSFALEIARSIGFPKEVIDKAKNLVGYSHVKFESLINQLEFEKNKFKEKSEELSKKEKWLEKEVMDYRDLKEALEDEKSEVISSAKSEAKRIVSESNKLVEQTIREIKEVKADKEKTRQIRKNLQDHKEKIETLRPKKEKKHVPKVTPGIPLPGDSVRIKGQDSIGELVKIKGKKAEVLMGSIKSLVDISRLEKVGGHEPKSYNKISTVKGVNYQKRAAAFSPSLDLRGNRAEEAVAKLDSFIDEALLLGINELRIIHGKGNGILREVIRNYLRDYNYIKSIADESVEQGGAGVSVVTLE